ncbi:hypothetical protein [Candidatus Uabimicrobium sp. HlEnr_7]|uniref:hypothetical protein n=1 Tax=Candidatus Uabimicrobium helgolandensis TaxID=3095367 RepID=UPI0035574098
MKIFMILITTIISTSLYASSIKSAGGSYTLDGVHVDVRLHHASNRRGELNTTKISLRTEKGTFLRLASVTTDTKHRFEGEEFIQKNIFTTTKPLSLDGHLKRFEIVLLVLDKLDGQVKTIKKMISINNVKMEEGNFKGSLELKEIKQLPFFLKNNLSSMESACVQLEEQAKNKIDQSFLVDQVESTYNKELKKYPGNENNPRVIALGKKIADLKLQMATIKKENEAKKKESQSEKK